MSADIPILMYHGIVADDAQAPPSWSPTHTIAWSQFSAQIESIARARWHSMLSNELSNRPNLNGARLAITFDDGHASDLAAAQLLAESGLRAIFYVACAHLDRPGYLSRGDVVRLSGLGCEIGSHGIDHVALTMVDNAALRRELWESKLRLEELAGAAVCSFACPFGAYDRRVLNAALGLGYETVMTSDFRRADLGGGPILPRLPILCDTTPMDFQALLTAGSLGTARRRIKLGLLKRSRRLGRLAAACCCPGVRRL